MIAQAHGTRPGVSRGHPGQAEGERHAHRNAERRDQQQCDRSLGRERPRDQLGKPDRQDDEIGACEQDDAADGDRDGSPPALLDFSGNAAAETRKDQKRGQHHGDRRQRVAEKHREAMDEADLDEHEPEAERQEIEPPPSTGPRRRPRLRRLGARSPGPKGRERQQDQDEAREPRLHQGGEDDEVTGIGLGQSALCPQGEELRQQLELEEAEEVRPIVGRGLDMELVGPQEPLALRPQQRGGGAIQGGFLQPVEAVRFRLPDARKPGDIEGARLRERSDPRDLGRIERRLLHEERGRVPTVDHGELDRPARRRPPVREPRTAVAKSLIGSRGGERSQRVIGEEPAGCEMRVIGLQCLDGVERALTEGLDASRGRHEGVEERDLDQVPAPRARLRRSCAPQRYARSRPRGRRSRPRNRRILPGPARPGPDRARRHRHGRAPW